MDPYDAEPRPSIARAVIIAGLVGGVLGVLPILNGCNCCCLWYIVTGIIAVFVYKGASQSDVSAGLGALLGLTGGIINGLIAGIGQFLYSKAQLSLVGDPESEVIQGCRDSLASNPEVLEQFNQQLEQMSAMTDQDRVVWLALSMVIMSVVGVIMSTLAGIITAAVAGKKKRFTDEPPPYRPEG